MPRGLSVMLVSHSMRAIRIAYQALPAFQGCSKFLACRSSEGEDYKAGHFATVIDTLDFVHEYHGSPINLALHKHINVCSPSRRCAVLDCGECEIVPVASQTVVGPEFYLGYVARGGYEGYGPCALVHFRRGRGARPSHL